MSGGKAICDLLQLLLNNAHSCSPYAETLPWLDSKTKSTKIAQTPTDLFQRTQVGSLDLERVHLVSFELVVTVLGLVELAFTWKRKNVTR